MDAKITGQAHRLRIYVGESDRYHHHALYHAIVIEARKRGLAGATVVRAIEGFGPSKRLHTANMLDLSADLPIVIEIIDSEEYLKPFIAILDEMMTSGLVTMDPVNIIHYGPAARNMTEDPSSPSRDQN